jgi:hypothetical protein
MEDSHVQSSLSKISKLYRSWNLGINDWCLMSCWALHLNGYDIWESKNFNTPVNAEKLPWKTKNDYQTLPPIGSKEYKDYVQLMKETGCSLHMTVFPWGEVTQENILKRSFVCTLPDGEKIRVLTVEGELWAMEIAYDRWKDEVGEEKKEKWQTEFKKIYKLALEKKDSQVIKACEDLFRKHEIKV